MSSSDNITDPVSEIIDFTHMLRAYGNSQSSTYIFIAQKLQLQENSPEIFDIFGSINHRIANLKRFGTNVQSKYVTSRTRQTFIAAIETFGSGFACGNLSVAWDTAAATHFNDNVLHDLEVLAPIAADFRPLKKLSKDEQEELDVKIEEILQSSKDDVDLPDWAVAAFNESLLRLRLILRLLPFFGHEAALDQIVLLKSRTEALNGAIARTSLNHGSSSLFRAIEIIVVIGHTLCLPADAAHAMHTYHQWLSGPVIEQQMQIEGGGRKLLPRPENPTGKVITDA